MRLRLSRPSGSVPVPKYDLANRKSASLSCSLPCFEQGVLISNARFEHNSAPLGGALGVSPDRTKNSFFKITSSTFLGNMALIKGGAIHISGSQCGALLSGGCVFRDNRASANSTSYDGQSSNVMRDKCGGGSISVEDGAELRLHDAQPR